MARLFVTLQYWLPHHLLGRLIYALSHARVGWLKNCLIRVFVRHYRPRMSDALEPEPLHYDSFNAFFTRRLAPAARPIEPDARRILSPCDGAVSMAGALQNDQLLQAKGHRYDLSALLAADAQWTSILAGGAYATLYLAPRDYHRVHMPLDGRLHSAWHVPGRLFSVNAATVARVPGLFARNERVVCVFDGDQGAFAVVLVGALCVGSMNTVWHGEITPWRQKSIHTKSLHAVHRLNPSTGIDLWQPRGAELGRFNMGSTVVLLLPAGRALWDSTLTAGVTVKVGEGLGTLLAPAAPARAELPA